jgi:CheY-like chemotaxis protein
MKKILVVEDDVDIVEGLQFLLEGEGFEVAVSLDGVNLPERIGRNKPDLIIMDYWLPKQNGGDITKRLKAKTETSDIPVIIISASYNVQSIVAQCGANSFIPKPYNISTLLTVIDQYIAA